jgi:hypothetical protein
VSVNKHVSMRLEGDTRSAARARKAVRSFLAGCDEHFVETATLLTDELVTNALVHGLDPCDVTLDLLADRLRVSVVDASTSLPRVLMPSLTREYGRGISIVTALSTRWGAHSTGGAKEVWFELLVPDGPTLADGDGSSGAGPGADGPAG